MHIHISVFVLAKSWNIEFYASGPWILGIDMKLSQPTQS